MTEPYVGQIEAFAFMFAPSGWACCDGQLLSVEDYSTLYSLIGTTYGGDGMSTFAVPDLRGRAPVQAGSIGMINHDFGQPYGSETSKLTGVPEHSHTFLASSGTNLTSIPIGNSLGAAPIYSKAKLLNTTELGTATIGPSPGAGAPFSIMQPYLAVNWCISLFGQYPPNG